MSSPRFALPAAFPRLFLPVVLLAPVAARGDERLEGLLIAPKKVSAGSETSVTVRAFGLDGVARDAGFRILLGEEGRRGRLVAGGRTGTDGWQTVAFDVPEDQPPGPSRWTAEIEGVGELLDIRTTVVATPVVLIETDRPIYKPGQRIRGRVLLLDNALRPRGGDVELDIRDAAGNRIHRDTIAANAFGVAAFELPLADELKTGEWTVEARSGQATADVAVRVEPYVPPRFRVDVELDRGWFLAGEPITGAVRSSYFFGRTVEGEVRVEGRRFVDGDEVAWATFTAPLADGVARFEIEPRLARMARDEETVSLRVAVTDAAGHEETTAEPVKITRAPFRVHLRPGTPAARPGFPYGLLVATVGPDGRPVSREVTVIMEAVVSRGGGVITQERGVVAEGGTARVRFDIPEAVEIVNFYANGVEDGRSMAYLFVPVAYSPSRSFLQLSGGPKAPVDVGDFVELELEASRPGETYYEVMAAGRTVRASLVKDTVRFRVTADMAPEARVVVYRIFAGGELGSDSRAIQVRPEPAAGLDVAFDAAEVEPGSPVRIEVAAAADSMVGLAVVDESVASLGRSGIEPGHVYAELAARFGGPTRREREQRFFEDPHTVGSRDVLDDAGLAAAVSAGADSDGAVDIPRGEQVSGWWWWDDCVFCGIPFAVDLGPGVRGRDAADAGTETLPGPPRVRQFFPETWLWEPELLTDASGRATLEVIAPDSITSWKLRAVSTSEAGLGLAAADLVVFQDFFVEPDIPYAVTRGEEMWLPVSVFNYLESPQTVVLELERSDGFEILGESSVVVDVGPSSVTGASFPIRATAIGTFPFELLARGQVQADAVVRPLRVEPEGRRREVAVNRVIRAGETAALDTSLPAGRVPGSGKLILTVTGSQVAQTIQGVEDLVGKPYG